MSRVLVVGAGVVGLSCAVRLLEAGHRVDVVARDLPLETTSVVAAAVVLPYRAGPARVDPRWTAWTARSEAVFADLAEDPDSGVRLLPGIALGSGPTRELVVPVVDMPAYLRWLVACVDDLGGTLTRLNLAALPTPARGGLVVNCSGLGARLLGGDPGVTPVAGQVVVVEQVGLQRWSVDDRVAGRPSYVVPRRREIVLGGTADTGEWSRTPSAATAADLLERASRLEPTLAGAKVLRHRVGLRPARELVRLERTGDGSGEVIHCYGHGGSGVTLAWGCAEEVVALAATSRDHSSS